MRVYGFLALMMAGACAFCESPAISSGVILQQDLFNVSMKEDVACYRIPALVTAANGDLVVSMDERMASCEDLGTNRNINIVVRRSADDGATWSGIETVADFPDGGSASDSSMIVDRTTGEILLFYNYMDHANAPDIYCLHVVNSRDNGKTWGAAEDITPQISKPEWRKDFMFITSERGTQTRSGILLHTLVHLNKGVHVFGSRDHGASWFLVDAPLEPGDESKIVELDDGTWMVNSRVSKAGMRYVHASPDSGKTWTTRPEPALVDSACNASCIRYTSIADGYDRNRLLFSNANDEKSRKNMAVRVSYDEGKTWTAGKTVYEGEAAYSSLTVLKNGDIGLLFEKDDYTHNEFVRFSLEWLTDGKDRYTPPQKQ